MKKILQGEEIRAPLEHGEVAELPDGTVVIHILLSNDNAPSSCHAYGVECALLNQSQLACRSIRCGTHSIFPPRDEYLAARLRGDAA